MDRSKRRAWTLAAAGATLLIVLYVTGGVLSGLRSTANLVVEPFSWTINEIARPVGHLFAGAINYSDVVAQNEKLRYELGRAEILSNESASMLHQLEQLTTELNVPFVGSLATVAAQVTTISPTNFAAAVDISKGADDGVLVGMPVVANGGLVGSVISTSPHGSTVRLITDVNSVVGVTYAKGTTSILISGRGVNNGLSATAISLTTLISPGTLVSTDGLRGGLYPPGLPVAKVANVTLTPGAATYDLTMIPTANLRNLAYVDVVLWEPST